LESITFRDSTRGVIDKSRHRVNLQNVVQRRDGLHGANIGNYSHREHRNTNIIARICWQHCQHEVHYNCVKFYDKTSF
jgi:hypothetical protein